MKNAVIYARFSSHSQNEQSIEGQLKECYAFAERNGYKLIHEYIDRALTGTTDKRPEFLRMIEDSKRKQFKFVIVYQLDRFARNRYDSATYKAKLKKNGVRVLSAKENITDDASGILIEGVLESMAEYYSVELGQKIRRGMALSAEKCQFFGGSVPLGYKVDENKKYVIDEENAPVVKQMFEMLASGSTYADIARHMNERGVKTSTGGKFNKGSFTRLFENRKYLGKYIYKGKEIDGGIPRIIEDSLFAEVQTVLAKYAEAPSRGKAKVEYHLSDKMICGYCGNKITGISGTSRTQEKHNYYQCYARTARKCCDKKTVKKLVPENKLIDYTIKEALTDEFIDVLAAETYLMIQAENNDAEIKRLDGLIAENQRAVNNLMQALMLGKASQTILAQIEKLENENKELKDAIEYERALQIEYTYNDIRKWLLHFRELDYSKDKHRRDLIDVLVYKVILYDDKMKILYNLKGGQQGEVLLSLIFDDYPDGNGGGTSGGNKKESDETLSLNDDKNGGSFTSYVVEVPRVELGSDLGEKQFLQA